MIKELRYARTREEQSREENASAVVRPQEYQLEYTTMFGSCGTTCVRHWPMRVAVSNHNRCHDRADAPLSLNSVVQCRQSIPAVPRCLLPRRPSDLVMLCCGTPTREPVPGGLLSYPGSSYAAHKSCRSLHVPVGARSPTVILTLWATQP